MSDDRWNPDLYARFRNERSAPFFDLLALVERRPAMRCADLGCGTGELTRHLHDVLAAPETLGIDSSDAMLAKTAEHATAGLRFERGDLSSFDAPGVFDLIFSNAAIHWVDDHATLLARLTARLAPDGQLAIQVPANFDHASHVVAAEVAREEPFASALGSWTRSFPVLAPEAYALLLHRLGYRRQHVRLQVYAHLLTSRDDVIEWVKGTLLTAYEARLPSALYPAFLARFRAALLPRLDDERPYLYPFKRILFWGARSIGRRSEQPKQGENRG